MLQHYIMMFFGTIRYIPLITVINLMALTEASEKTFVTCPLTTDVSIKKRSVVVRHFAPGKRPEILMICDWVEEDKVDCLNRGDCGFELVGNLTDQLIASLPQEKLQREGKYYSQLVPPDHDDTDELCFTPEATTAPSKTTEAETTTAKAPVSSTNKTTTEAETTTAKAPVSSTHKLQRERNEKYHAENMTTKASVSLLQPDTTCTYAITNLILLVVILVIIVIILGLIISLNCKRILEKVNEIRRAAKLDGNSVPTHNKVTGKSPKTLSKQSKKRNT